MSIVEVVDTQGRPNGRMWQRRPDNGVLVLVYEGRNAYSIRIKGLSVMEIILGRLGGPTTPFNQPAYEVLAADEY